MDIKNLFKKNHNKNQASNERILTRNKKNFFEEITQAKNVQGLFECIQTLPNPDVILKKAGKRIEVLDSLTNHYQVGTCIDSRKSGTAKKLWSLEKRKTSSKNLDFYNDLFEKNIKVYNTVREILDTPLFGFTVFEIIWEAKEGKIIPKEIKSKPQEWFEFDTERRIYLKGKTGKIYLDEYPQKFIVMTNNATYKNPYGQAVLSRCFWNVAFINGGLEFWVKFTEKYGMPFLFGKYDRSMSDNERIEMLEQLEVICQDGVGVIPDNGNIDFLDCGSKGVSAEVYEKLIQKCEGNIAKSILGQTLTTDIGNIGSYAASNTHNQVRGDIIDSDTRLCENFFNILINYINELNFGEEDTPTFVLYEEEDIDLSIAERDIKIYSAGGRFTKDYFIKTYGFNEGDIEVINPTDFLGVSNFSEYSAPHTQQKDTTDDFLETFEQQDFEKLLNPILMPIVEYFKQTTDAEDCLEKIAEIYPDMNTKELEDTLTKVIFMSSLLGRIEK